MKKILNNFGHKTLLLWVFVFVLFIHLLWLELEVNKMEETFQTAFYAVLVFLFFLGIFISWKKRSWGLFPILPLALSAAEFFFWRGALALPIAIFFSGVHTIMMLSLVEEIPEKKN